MQFLDEFSLFVLVWNAILFHNVQQVDRTCIRGPKHLVYFVWLSFQALYQLNCSLTHFSSLLLLVIEHKLDLIASCLVSDVMLMLIVIIFESFQAPDQKERPRCVIVLCRGVNIGGVVFSGISLVATHCQHLRRVLSLIGILAAIVWRWRWVNSLEVACRYKFLVTAAAMLQLGCAATLLLHLDENLGLLMLDHLFMPFELDALAHAVVVCDD